MTDLQIVQAAALFSCGLMLILAAALYYVLHQNDKLRAELKEARDSRDWYANWACDEAMLRIEAENRADIAERKLSLLEDDCPF
jgi:hypothetical protein